MDFYTAEHNHSPKVLNEQWLNQSGLSQTSFFFYCLHYVLLIITFGYIKIFSNQRFTKDAKEIFSLQKGTICKKIFFPFQCRHILRNQLKTKI